MDTPSSESRSGIAFGADGTRNDVLRLTRASLSGLVAAGGWSVQLPASAPRDVTAPSHSPRRLARLHRIGQERERLDSAVGRSQELTRIRWYLNDAPGSIQLPGGGGILLSN
jgi:hypothetical protein